MIGHIYAPELVTSIRSTSRKIPPPNETPEITWCLPIAQDLSTTSIGTNSNTLEAFPDFRNPANNLILARTALLGQLDILHEQQAHSKHRSKRPLLLDVIHSIHSRVVSHTGHIKENEDLTRSRAAIASTLAAQEQARAARARGNKGKLISHRYLYGREHQTDAPVYELQKRLKVLAGRGIQEAFAYEREYGWDVVVEDPATMYGDGDGVHDFHDPYWQLKMISPLEPGAELTRKVIISLLKLKQTFPRECVNLEINPAAVLLGLRGRAAETETSHVPVVQKAPKLSRLLGLPCDASSRGPRSRSSSSSGESPAVVSVLKASVNKSAVHSKTVNLKARTATFVRRVATKITLGRPSNKSAVLSGKPSASANFIKNIKTITESDDESDSESFEDSDDEYADAAEFLKQEARSKDKVSQWLALSFDGESSDDPSSIEAGAFEPLVALSPTSAPLPSTEELVLPSVVPLVPASSSSAPSWLASGKPQSKSATSKVTAAPALNHSHELAAYTPISTFSPFETADNQASPLSPSLSSISPDDSGVHSDSDSEQAQYSDIISFTAVKAITLERPKTPARVVSIRKKAKDSLKRQISVLSLKSASKAAPPLAEPTPAASSSSAKRAFHGGLISHPHLRTATAKPSPATNRNGPGSVSSSFSQRQREFLHRGHHQRHA